MNTNDIRPRPLKAKVKAAQHTWGDALIVITPLRGMMLLHSEQWIILFMKPNWFWTLSWLAYNSYF